jgi:hypothetical protein
VTTFTIEPIPLQKAAIELPSLTSTTVTQDAYAFVFVFDQNGLEGGYRHPGLEDHPGVEAARKAPVQRERSAGLGSREPLAHRGIGGAPAGIESRFKCQDLGSLG